MCRATLLSFLLIFAQPAWADQWISYAPNQTVSSTTWSGSRPPTVGDGQELPSGYTVAEWTPQNGDGHADHYTLQQDGTLAYTPPVISPPPPSPDPITAKNLIFSDPNIPAAAMSGLLQNSGISLINDYPANPEGSRAVWGFLKQEFGSSWLTSAVINAIETDCAQANIMIGMQSSLKMPKR